MRELVYISANVPNAVANYVHGLWQRQKMFIDALAPMFDSVHCVFWKGLGPGEVESESEVINKARAAFDCDVKVTLLQPAARDVHPGYFDYYAKSILFGPAGHGHRRVIGPRETAQLEACLPAHPAMVFAQGLEVMSTVARLARRPPRVAWDLNDLEALKHLRELKVTPWTKGKPLLYLQTVGLFAEERRAAHAADVAFVCSDVDRRRAQALLGGNFKAAPNAVTVPAKPLGMADGSPSILFVGFFGYEPNRHAMDWFIDAIWPRVAQQVPDARLRVVGARPERLSAFGKPLRHVELLGFVDDLQSEYERAHLVICPILSGSGTRVKLLEAAANARPIVSTRLGAEGLDFEHRRSAWLCDEPAAFADACLALLRDRALAEQLGRQAWEMVRGRYSREAVIDGIRRDIQAGPLRFEPLAEGALG